MGTATTDRPATATRRRTSILLAAAVALGAVAAAPGPTACASTTDAEDDDRVVHWFHPSEEPRPESAVSYVGTLGPRADWEADETHETVFTIRQDPVGGHGRAVFSGPHTGPVEAIELDVFRGLPEHEDPVERLHVGISLGGHELFSGDVQVSYTGAEEMHLCHLTNGWFTTRVVNLAPVIEDAGLDPDGTHELRISLGMPSTAPTGAHEVLGLHRNDTPSRVVVNPRHPRPDIPRTSAGN